jgi:TolB-like protein
MPTGTGRENSGVHRARPGDMSLYGADFRVIAEMVVEKSIRSVTAFTDAGAVRAELDRILGDDLFRDADALARLLRYVVEEALAGRSDTLKEYTLGVEVFQRGPEFDPRIDTIVRTQVRRLRAKLKDYYSKRGQHDPVVIEVPTGSYVPEIRHIGPAPQSGGARRAPPYVLAGGLAACLVVLSALSLGLVKARSELPTPPSVAVLPFSNLSQDPSLSSLADGLSEELGHALSRSSGLRVLSRTSVLQYRNKGADVRKLGDNLAVDAVVEGSVRKASNRVRVTASLVSTKNGYRLWTESWEGTPVLMEYVPDKARRGIESALGLKTSAEPAPPATSEAYRLYLKGRFGPDNQESVAALDRALQLSPGFGAAWLAKAEFYARQARRAIQPPTEALSRARQAATTAIQRGTDVAQAHAILGYAAAVLDWDWNKAESEYRRAIEIEPHGVWARLQYAQLLGFMGRNEEAAEQMARAEAGGVPNQTVAVFHAAFDYMNRRYDRTIERCRAVLEVSPQTSECHFWIGRALLSMGKPAAAVEAFEKRDPGDLHQGFGVRIAALAAAGNRNRAMQLRARAEETARSTYVSPVSLALAHFGLGELAAGFAQLERAVQVRDQSLPTLGAEPAYDGVRSDTRFQQLLRKMHLR